MRKNRIYLDTSVISHLEAHDTPERMRDTQKFWDILGEGHLFEIFISSVTERELDDCPQPKRTFLLQHLADISFESIDETEEILALAEEYVKQGVLSKKHFNDLLHIAHAVVADCSIIASWNFKHFVNIRTIDRVNAVNLTNGYQQVKIVPPSMLISEGDDHEL